MAYTRTTFENLANKVSRISWGAIFAGTLTALAVVLMLNLLGLGIGLTTIDPMTEANPLKGLGTGALIWMGISNLVALFVGGLVAGRMSGLPSNSDGGLHGFLAWALFAMISIYLITSSIGTMVNGMSSAISGLFGNSQSEKIIVQMDEAQKKGKSNVDFSYDNIKSEAFQLINKAEKYDILPEDASGEARETINEVESETQEAYNKLNLDENIDQFFNDLSFDLDDNGDLNITVDGNQDFLNKEDMKSYLINNTELSESEIDGLVNKWDKNIEKAVNKAESFYAKAKQKAIVYSDKAADAIGKLSIAAFLIFFFGALAAFFGGATGSPLLTVSEERKEEKYD
jgi:vacuolar-type H+-ATPase subunit H